jgi:hypothetical protein
MATPANINAPSGLTPVKHAAGGTPVRVNNGADYAIASGLASNIYRGSLVKPTGTGNNIDVVAAGNNPSLGTFHGVNYVASNGDTQFRPYWATGTTAQTGSVPEATVFDDPQLLFDGQVSGAAGLVAADIGKTANILIGTGSTLTGTSGDLVDQATLSNSSTTQQLQVQSLRQIQGNNYGQYARALLSIFLHYKNAVAGAGTVY